LYSACNETSPQGAQVWITQGCPCKLHHTFLYLANVRQMAPPEWQTSNSSSLLIYRPPKDERLSWPSWLTYSGRYTHISGHTSAVDRAEVRESSPVRDRRSNLTASWTDDHFVGKPSAVGQPTRPTQPFILTGSINE